MFTSSSYSVPYMAVEVSKTNLRTPLAHDVTTLVSSLKNRMKSLKNRGKMRNQ